MYCVWRLWWLISFFHGIVGHFQNLIHLVLLIVPTLFFLNHLKRFKLFTTVVPVVIWVKINVFFGRIEPSLHFQNFPLDLTIRFFPIHFFVFLLKGRIRLVLFLNDWLTILTYRFIWLNDQCLSFFIYVLKYRSRKINRVELQCPRVPFVLGDLSTFLELGNFKHVILLNRFPSNIFHRS